MLTWFSSRQHQHNQHSTQLTLRKLGQSEPRLSQRPDICNRAPTACYQESNMSVNNYHQNYDTKPITVCEGSFSENEFITIVDDDENNDNLPALSNNIDDSFVINQMADINTGIYDGDSKPSSSFCTAKELFALQHSQLGNSLYKAKFKPTTRTLSPHFQKDCVHLTPKRSKQTREQQMARANPFSHTINKKGPIKRISEHKDSSFMQTKDDLLDFVQSNPIQDTSNDLHKISLNRQQQVWNRSR